MEKKRILLIEDNPDMRDNTAEILELADYTVTTAENGKEGVAKAREMNPDLIICDIMMPELDGYGVLRMLGKSPETAAIPFIFLTAKAEKTDFRKGMNLGADDYITKPFDDLELMDAIEMRMKKSEILTKEYDRDAEGLGQFIQDVKAMDALQALTEDKEHRVYKKKESIYHEGNFPHGIYFVANGKLRTFKTNEDAKEYTTGLYKAGEFLGYLPLLRDTQYEESAMALEDTEVIVIPKDDFFRLMHNNRDVSNKFIKMLSDNLSEKEEELLHLAYDSVRKRVADALVQLREKFKTEEQEDPFSMSVSRDHLASIVGTSKECVIRVLSEFKDDGFVKTKLSEITILEPEKLSRLPY